MQQTIYYIRLLLFLPLIPFMKRDGKNVRLQIPKLEEPKDITGKYPNDSTPSRHILFIGESTIAGVGVDSHADGIPGSFCKKYFELTGNPSSWTVIARSGYTAKQVNDKLLKLIPEKEYEFIIIGLGANDAFTLNSPNKWKTEIVKLISSLNNKFQNTPILFLNMPPIKEFPALTRILKLTIDNHVDLLGATLQSIVAQHKYVYYNSEKIRLDSWSRKYNLPFNDTTIYFSDGIHPAKNTYELWADSALEFLIDNNILSSRGC